MIFLDTHIAVCLANDQIKKLSHKGRKLIENEELYVSPISLLELNHLFKINRIKKDEGIIFSYLKTQIGLQQSQTPVDDLVRVAKNLDWSRDFFDRLIVADCIVNGGLLITKDTIILENYPNAIWD